MSEMIEHMVGEWIDANGTALPPSDTPRTDAAVRFSFDGPVVCAAVARELERELARVRNEAVNLAHALTIHAPEGAGVANLLARFQSGHNGKVQGTAVKPQATNKGELIWPEK